MATSHNPSFSRIGLWTGWSLSQWQLSGKTRSCCPWSFSDHIHDPFSETQPIPKQLFVCSFKLRWTSCDWIIAAGQCGSGKRCDILNAEPGRPTRVGYVSEEEEMNDDDDDEEIQSGDDDANPGNERDEEMTPAEWPPVKYSVWSRSIPFHWTVGLCEGKQ